MSDSDDKTTVRSFFARLTAGEIEAAVSLIADDGEFWQAGSDGPGRVMSLTELKGMFRGVIGAIPGGVAFTVIGMLEENGTVAAQVSCDATLANGRPYRNNYCFFFDLRDGTIVGGREYMDTQHAVSAFSAKREPGS